MEFDDEEAVVVLFPDGGGTVGVARVDMGEIGLVGSEGAKENCVSRVGRVIMGYVAASMRELLMWRAGKW